MKAKAKPKPKRKVKVRRYSARQDAHDPSRDVWALDGFYEHRPEQIPTRVLNRRIYQ